MNTGKVDIDAICEVDAWVWAYHNRLRLSASEFQIAGHEYQGGMMSSVKQRRVYRKAAQMSFSESEILRTLHGMIYGFLPKGCLYLFPTDDDVSEFSKARFSPLIEYNQKSIGRFVTSTDATNIKRVGNAFLYLHGARATQNVRGKKDSSKLRSRSVDKVVFDERDLMADEMVAMALERFSHSEVQEEVEISTPTIPDWGIDKSYEASSQGIWEIKCLKCGSGTCMELEFPNCLSVSLTGDVRRVCKKCGSEIYPRDGRWVFRYPDRDIEGFWISQLNSAYVSPKRIWEMYQSGENRQEFYNSKMGMSYMEVENQLTSSQVLACCNRDAMYFKHPGPCAMGVDVGKQLHVTVGFRPDDRSKQVVYVARVSTFNDVHDIAARFGVRSAVIDSEPETRKAREFADSEPYPVWLCDYSGDRTALAEPKWDDSRKAVTVLRTAICDETHAMVVDRKLIIPRECEEIKEFVLELTKTARVLEEDKETGSRRYNWKKLGADHYYHSLNYFNIAARELPACRASDLRRDERVMGFLKSEQNYGLVIPGQGRGNPLYHGLKVVQ